MKQLLLALVILVGSSATALALEKEPYSADRLSALQQQGALVLVDIFAPWCPVCAKQQEILSEYVAQNPDVNLHILQVDFDNDKDAVTALRAPRQSTLLLYKGEAQYWYSVAETRKEVIFAELDKAAGKE